MKKNLFFIAAVILTIFTFVNFASAQRRNSKSGLQRHKTAKSSRPIVLTIEQKDDLQLLISKVDSIEQDLSLVYRKDSSSLEGEMFCTNSPISRTGLPKSVDIQVESVISIYCDLSILYGRLHNVGYYNSKYKYDLAFGNKPVDLVPAISATYNLQFLTLSQAVDRLHSAAFLLRNRLQYTLLNSQTSR